MYKIPILGAILWTFRKAYIQNIQYCSPRNLSLHIWYPLCILSLRLLSPFLSYRRTCSNSYCTLKSRIRLIRLKKQNQLIFKMICMITFSMNISLLIVKLLLIFVLTRICCEFVVCCFPCICFMSKNKYRVNADL